MSDVVVIGAGPNGLTAANVVADHGLSVVVCEAQAQAGGAVRSAQVTLPGFEHDLYSAFYPFAAASPAIRSLKLEDHGLRWCRAPLVLAHPSAEGPAALLSTNLDETAASLDAFSPGDGDGWRELYELWQRIAEPFMQSFATPFPPLLGAARLAAAIGPQKLLAFTRMAMLPVRRLGAERFDGAGGSLLLAGNALHADLTPDSAAGGMFGWILSAIGQQHGFPIPEGGASRLTEAMVRRLESLGGTVLCNAPVERIVVRGGRAVAVRLADGRELPAPAGVIADVGAPQLYFDLLGADHLPDRMLGRLKRFQYDNSTVKVDWALREPLAWSNPEVRRAGTVHLGESMDLLTTSTTELERGIIPGRPWLVMGQYAAADPTRAPAGADTAWAYTHVPQRTRGDAREELTGRWDAAELDQFVERIEDEVERQAPGFRSRILARHIQGPHEFEAGNQNLVGGAINGGTAQIHQQLVFRPVPGLGRPETPVRGLYLGSSSAHPGGGVHGAPGSNAARALLAHRRLRSAAPLGVAAAAGLRLGLRLRRGGAPEG